MFVPNANAPEWMKKRYQISVDYCKKKGWDMDRLEIEQIMEIRKLPEWIEAGKM